MEQCPETPPSILPLQLWHAWTFRKEDPLFTIFLFPQSPQELKKQRGDPGSRQEGLGKWVGSHWGTLSDSREWHLRSPNSGALPQGGHPERPGSPERSHGCRAGPTCCVCFHSAEAVAATPLVVAFRPRYIMSSAPRLPRQRVIPLFSSPCSPDSAGVRSSAEDPDPGLRGGVERGRGYCSRLTEVERAEPRVLGFLVGEPRARVTRGAGT